MPKVMNAPVFYLSTIADVVPDESGTVLRYEDRAAALAVKHGFGLELAELGISENLDSPETAGRIHFEKNCRDVAHCILHAPYNELFPHAIEPRVRALAFERYHDAYMLCEAYGIPKMVVHANFVEPLYHPEWFVQRQIGFWREFLKAVPGKTVICIENVLEAEPAILTRIAAAMDDKRLRLCLDVGHANLTAVPPEQWTEEFLPYLSHMHLHDNHGPIPGVWGCVSDTHSALGTGTVRLQKILTMVRGVSPQVTFTLETAELEKSIVWLEENGFLETDTRRDV